MPEAEIVPRNEVPDGHEANGYKALSRMTMPDITFDHAPHPTPAFTDCWERTHI